MTDTNDILAPEKEVGVVEVPTEKPAPDVGIPEKTVDVEKSAPYDPTGNPGLDITLDFLYTNGVFAEHPAVLAAEAGDFTALEALLKEKGVPNWERYVALGKHSIQELQAAQANQAKQVIQDIVSVIPGGTEQWQKVVSWAASQADPAERDVVNATLRSGGIAAKAMAHFMFTMYSRTTTMDAPRTDLGAVARGGPATSSGMLTQEEYRAEFAKIMGSGQIPKSNDPRILDINRRLISR
jgi:hypothetical protein